jgi:NADH-quinone oxidoreductase subunit K
MTLTNSLLLAAALFCVGLYGMLSRKQAIATLLSLELMANAANIVFVAFGYFRGTPGHPMVLFSLAITVAEVAVGLALVMLLARRYGDTDIDLAQETKE